MSPAHRRYLMVEQGVGAAVVNFFLNGTIAWLLFRQQDIVPLWGQQSIVGDTIGTTFFLPFFTCLIVTRLVRGHMRRGRVAEPGWTRDSHPRLRWLPAGTLRRALALGGLTMVLVAPVAVLVLIELHVDSLTLWRFIAFKATFAAALAALVTPLIAVWAMAESSPA